MTLDDAKDAFEQAEGPNAKTAADLLRVATEYWVDDMISDGTYRDIVLMVARDLHESATG